MKSGTRVAGCLLAAVATLSLSAQDAGYWRAMSTTARSMTGDISITETKVVINFSAYTIAQIRTLQAEESAAVFSDAQPGGSGNLYRLSITGDRRFLHKNTLCGSDETQWMITYVAVKQMQVAFFSGPKIPELTTDAILNTTNLCGTYSYAR